MDRQNLQYVAVQFKPGEGRAYTYHNDGEPVAIGDKVVVSTNRGAANATVVGLSDDPPPFVTKAIIGKERLVEGPDSINSAEEN